jgi:NADPH:quinone reductase-like Zn-dependent oxidoreductase
VRAAIFKRYGPPEVLELADLPRPVPADDELLVRVIASTVSAPDWRVRKADPAVARLVMGLFRPKQRILGYEFAGDVVAVGSKVTQFKPGDAVFGMNVIGMKFKFGAYAEYVCVSTKAMVTTKPDTISYAEAATLPSGTCTAYSCIQAAKLKPGHKVLINGASGSIGTAALQLAKFYGAEVTAVCNRNKVEFLQALGAAHVIDYTREDFTQSERRYDFILDAVGFSSFVRCRHLLTPSGAYLSTGANAMFQNMYYAIKTRNSTGKRVLTFGGKMSVKDLEFFKQLVAEKLLRPVVDRCYPLEQVADAHRYTELGHKKGNVVIMIGE